jgi:hypothetical protein
MKRGSALLLLLLTGCSTAPIADVMDWLVPGRLPPDKTTPYGGVCLPQGVIAPTPTAVAPVPAPLGATPFVPPPPPPVSAAPSMTTPVVAPVAWPPKGS